MSTPSTQGAETAAHALEHACQMLLEVAAHHVAGHASLQELVSAAQALVKANRAANLVGSKAPREPLVALRHTGRLMNTAVPPDPRELIWVYGADKLARALQEYRLTTLKLVAESVERNQPNAPRPDHRVRQSVIDYIVVNTPKDIGDWHPSMLPPVHIP